MEQHQQEAVDLVRALSVCRAKNIVSALESSMLQTRSDLMITLRDIVNSKKWSQGEAAEQLGLAHSRLRDLLNGRIDKFSLDQLITCLYRVGFPFKPSYVDDKLTMTVESVGT